MSTYVYIYIKAVQVLYAIKITDCDGLCDDDYLYPILRRPDYFLCGQTIDKHKYLKIYYKISMKRARCIV